MLGLSLDIELLKFITEPGSLPISEECGLVAVPAVAYIPTPPWSELIFIVFILYTWPPVDNIPIALFPDIFITPKLCPLLTGLEVYEWLLRKYTPIADSPSILITPVLSFLRYSEVEPLGRGLPLASILRVIARIPIEPFPPILIVPALLTPVPFEA